MKKNYYGGYRDDVVHTDIDTPVAEDKPQVKQPPVTPSSPRKITKSDVPAMDGEKWLQSYQLADEILTKRYIANLSSYKVVPIEKELQQQKVSQISRFIKVGRIAYNTKENNQDKLLNVYHALYTCGGTVVLLLKSNGHHVDFYLGVRGTDTNNVITSQKVLEKAIQGNFPGTELNFALLNPEVDKLFDTTFDAKKTIAAVSSIPSFRHTALQSQQGFVQGLETLVNSMHGEAYTLLVIAEPISPNALDMIRKGYEGLYTQLVPLSERTISIGENQSEAVNTSLAKGFSKGITTSLSQVSSTADSSSTSHSFSESHGTNSSKNVMGGVGFLGMGMAGVGYSKGESQSSQVTDGHTTGRTISKGTQSGTANTTQEIRNETTGNTHTSGNSSTEQIKFVNKSAQVLLKKIDNQLNRLEECNDVGVWNFAAYVVADDAQTSQVVASTYQALLRGEDSGTEISAVTVWEEPQQVQNVLSYIKTLHHPRFLLNEAAGQLVTPATYISGKELTLASGLPQKSIPGLPVANFVPFGREVVWQQTIPARTMTMGQVYHMGQTDTKNVVKLGLDELTAHTFITGSTGTGKSNTVYDVLQNLMTKQVPWLVIEPAKGEYKDTFGGYKNVNVYGTNPSKFPHLLQINPFSFPDDVHVLEHIDRLVEIFNACWPMYAAMPAILREAMERSYEACGWSLKLSKNPGVFPTFATLLQQLPLVVDSSAYSANTSNDYKGALVTRVRSLTRGIHGMVFEQDTPMKSLLAENCIIDLSRIGSQETKSLIMGVLLLKIQEYRMSEPIGNNNQLRHVTVLEEAHNLLKRTSDVQTQESANVQGQAVTMMANAIAEMRTYGEGFVIVDQSPGLMDMSAVRNTNTKIILRLPDQEDRELVGKAAALTDEQVEELSRLERGVAAIYQSNWEEPVLCKLYPFNEAKSMEERFGSSEFTWEDTELQHIQDFLSSVFTDKPQTFDKVEQIQLCQWIHTLGISQRAVPTFSKALEGKTLDTREKLVVLRYVLEKRLETPDVADYTSAVDVLHSVLQFKYNMGLQSETVQNVERLLATQFSDTTTSSGILAEKQVH